MRRVLLVVLLAGCAQAVPTPSATPTSTTKPAPSVTSPDKPRPTPIFSGPNVATMYKEAAVAANQTFSKPPASVSAAVRLAYASLGIPVTVDLASGARIGNADFYRTRTFAGKAMTELVACGTSMTGPNAASYRIYMSLLTSVVADGRGGTTVGVIFESTARDVAGGASNDQIPCGTSGLLEQILFDKIASYVGK